MNVLQLGSVCIWIGLSLFYIPYSIIYRNVRTLKYITVLLVLQNMLTLFATNTLPSYVASFMILYKEMIMWGAVGYTLLINLKVKKSCFPIVLFVIYLLFEMLNGNAGLYTKLVCFRQITTPIILILFGRSLRLKANEYKSYFEFVVRIGVIQAIFGFAEEFLLGDRFWLSLNVSNLFKAKGFKQWVASGLPGNYYSYDLYHITGKSIRRLVGIETDPLLTAHYLTFCVVILLFIKDYNLYKRIIEIFVLTVAVLLTLSKGAALIIGIVFIYKIWMKNKEIAIGLGIISLFGTIMLIKTNLLRTIAIHIEGLTSSLPFFSAFGGGLGTAGNLASLSGESITAGESFLGMVIGQIGIIGLVLFLLVILLMLKSTMKTPKDNYQYAVVGYVFAVMIESVISESAINFCGSGIAFILLGLLSIRKKEKQENEEETGKDENRNTNLS